MGTILSISVIVSLIISMVVKKYKIRRIGYQCIYLIILVFPFFLCGCFCFGGPGCEPADPCDYYCPCDDGKVPVSNIARWDGTQWLPLGSGVNGKVEGIVIDSAAQELYVFGSFTIAGGVQVKNQAKWSEKTQTWSALGTEFGHMSYTYVSNIVASNGKVYYCNHSSNKLYNSDRTFVDRTGLVVWDGSKWRMLLGIINGQKEIKIPVVRAIIGSTLYLESQSFSDATDSVGMLYLFDLLTNQIFDSLPDRSPTYSLGYIHFSNDGLFTNEEDGIYRYFNGVKKKIMDVPKVNTGYAPLFNELSSSTEFVSYVNQQDVNSLLSESTRIIYDVNGDTTFTYPIKPLNHAILYSSKVSGHTLFIGGAYYLKDGSADVRNIGAYNLQEKKWYDLAGGVCGPVHAIAEMNGSIYVGGEFSTAGKK